MIGTRTISLAVLLVGVSGCASDPEPAARSNAPPTCIDMTVTHGGAPVADARVRFVWWEREPAFDPKKATRREEEARTDVAGRLVHSLARSASVYLSVEKDGLATACRSVSGGGKTEVHVDMETPVVVAGVLRDERGRPVRGAVASARYGAEEVESARTGPDGSFALRRLSAKLRYELTVAPPSPGHEGAKVELLPGTSRVEITLEFGATIAVDLHHPERSASVKDAEWLLVRREGEHWFPATDAVARSEAASDAMTFACIAPGEYRVLARIPGVGAGATAPIVVTDRAATRRTIELEQRRPVAGRVVDARGEAVSGAHVNLGTVPRARTAVVTDEDGAFAIDLPPIEACIVVSRSGIETVVAPVAAGESHPVEVVVLPSRP